MLAKLFEKQRLLIPAGAVSLLGAVVMVGLMLLDSTQVLGINRWIKPLKFFISIAIFVWTAAVYVNFLKGYETASRRISWGMIAIFSIEMFIIVLQAARGTTSHFNNSTPLDGILFAIMGLAIVANTILTIYLLYAYFTAEIDLPKAILWGMRLGLFVFLLGCIEGGYMSAVLRHSVGVEDGGAGLPLVNWSTDGGDLRVAHFFGMHAFQAVPIFAYLLGKFKLNYSTALTFAFAGGYFAIFTFLFVQALFGKPFLGF
jgi:hypothetical protein